MRPLIAKVVLFCLLAVPGTIAAGNQVLVIDGKNSYVELPPNIFNHLTSATVETWVKWKSFAPGNPSRIFSYGSFNLDAGIQATFGALNFFLVDGSVTPGLREVTVPEIVALNQWCHIAAWVRYGLGDLDETLDCLDRALAARESGLDFLNTMHCWKNVRSHPRIQAILRKMNLLK